MKKDKYTRRKIRVRSKLFGTGERPRISVFRSNKYIYVQAIDDKKRQTLLSQSSPKLKEQKSPKVEQAKLVGKALAKALTKKGVKMGLFDRGPYPYKGRVKALAEGLREGGIQI